MDEPAKIRIDDLIQRAQLGDRQSINDLVRASGAYVFSFYTARFADYATSQDLAQLTFLRLVAKIGQLRNPRCYWGWLRRLCHTQLCRWKQLVSVKWHAECSQSWTEIDEDFLLAVPDTAVLDNERDCWVAAAIAQIPKKRYRSLIRDYYFKGRSVKSLARVYHSELSTIKRQLHDARSILLVELSTEQQRAALRANPPPGREARSRLGLCAYCGTVPPPGRRYCRQCILEHDKPHEHPRSINPRRRQPAAQVHGGGPGGAGVPPAPRAVCPERLPDPFGSSSGDVSAVRQKRVAGASSWCGMRITLTRCQQPNRPAPPQRRPRPQRPA